MINGITDKSLVSRKRTMVTEDFAPYSIPIAKMQCATVLTKLKTNIYLKRGIYTILLNEVTEMNRN